MTVHTIYAKHTMSSARDLPVELDMMQNPPCVSVRWFDSALLESVLWCRTEARQFRLVLAGHDFDLALRGGTSVLRRPEGMPGVFSCTWAAAEGLLKIETDTLDATALFKHVVATFGEDYVADDQKFQRHARRAIEVNLSGLRFRAEFRRLFEGDGTVILSPIPKTTTEESRP